MSVPLLLFAPPLVKSGSSPTFFREFGDSPLRFPLREGGLNPELFPLVAADELTAPVFVELLALPVPARFCSVTITDDFGHFWT